MTGFSGVFCDQGSCMSPPIASQYANPKPLQDTGNAYVAERTTLYIDISDSIAGHRERAALYDKGIRTFAFLILLLGHLLTTRIDARRALVVCCTLGLRILSRTRRSCTREQRMPHTQIWTDHCADAAPAAKIPNLPKPALCLTNERWTGCTGGRGGRDGQRGRDRDPASRLVRTFCVNRLPDDRSLLYLAVWQSHLLSARS